MDNIENGIERLQKAMARLGIASRRHSEILIAGGKVKVNGVVVDQPGFKVKGNDVIEVIGEEQQPKLKKEAFQYILLNKPEGVISSVTDPRNRKTVVDLIKGKVKGRVYPVGRLDYDTSGLLILTNDGELTFRLTHPSYGVLKTYKVWLKGTIFQKALQQLREGVHLDDGLTSPAIINSVINNKGNNLTTVEISIHEGRNRQVRRMFEQVGHPVCQLKRIAFGPLRLEDEMQPGGFRSLSHLEISLLKKEVGLK